MRYLLIILLLLPLCTVSQQNSVELQESIAAEHIKKLKTGVLLVRLQRNVNKVGILRSMGRNKEADKFEKEERIRNLEIADAFKNYFSFCPVYFYYADHTNRVLSNNWKGIILEYSLTTPVLPENKENYYLLYSEKVYFKNMNSFMKGFAINDKDQNQLEKPFPYYVKQFAGLGGFGRSYKEMVQILQLELSEFYSIHS